MPPHIVVVGAGAIGGAIGAYLHRAGRRITLVDPWFHHVEAVRRDGLRLESPDEVFVSAPPILHVDELHRLDQPADVLVIAVKAYDTEMAYRLAAPYLRDDAPVLCAQNGIVEDYIVHYVEPQRIVGCVVSMAAEIVEPGFVRRTLASGWPSLTIGELSTREVTARVERLQELFSPLGEIHTRVDIVGDLWSKLALNSMTNGTGALTGATTRVLWGDEHFVGVAVAAAAETVVTARAVGVEIEPVFGRIPIEALVAAHDGDPDGADEAARILMAIAAERTGSRENKPSMLQDHLKGRRTEIDYINGHVVLHADRTGVAAPVNRRIVSLVRQLERGQIEQSMTNIEPLQDLVSRRHETASTRQEN